MTFGQAVRVARNTRRMSQAELAQMVGTTQSTIDRLERDEAARSRFAPDVAAILGIPLPYKGVDFPSDAMSRLSTIVAAPASQASAPKRLAGGEETFPIFAAAEGGRGTMVVSTDPIEHIRTPSVMKNVVDGFGVLVVGESMFPAYEPGDIALINPKLPYQRGTDIVFIAGEREGDFTASIKRLVGWDDDSWTVRQWNPPAGEDAEFALPRRDWTRALRVIGKYARR